MDLTQVFLRCKKNGLEKLITIPYGSEIGGYKNINFIPPKGTTIILNYFEDEKLNGKYKIVKVKGELNIGPSKHKDQVHQLYAPVYTIDIKKVKR